jgi:hypothetical protein
MTDRYEVQFDSIVHLNKEGARMVAEHIAASIAAHMPKRTWRHRLADFVERIAATIRGA